MIIELKLSEEDKKDIARMTAAEMAKDEKTSEPTKILKESQVHEFFEGVSRDNVIKILRDNKLGVKMGGRWFYTNTEINGLLVRNQGKTLV